MLRLQIKIRDCSERLNLLKGNAINLTLTCQVLGLPILSTQVDGFDEKTNFQHLDTEKENFHCQGVVVQDEKCQGGGAGGMVQYFFWNLIHFLDFQFKNTSNLIFLGFKVSSERFFHKDFKTGLTF